jgi:uncharacterized membrane protein (DUF2068 family)
MSTLSIATRKSSRAAERGVAVMEFLKGLAILLIGAGFATLLHRDHDVDDIAVNLLYVLHIRHHHHLSAIFLRAADKLQDTNLVLVAGVAGVYVILRFSESYGLWLGRAWAEWLALLSGAIYLPLEIIELFRRATPIRFGIFVINLFIVAYMGWLRWKAHRSTYLTDFSR